MTTTRGITRRHFIEVSSLAGAGLLIGFRLPTKGTAGTAVAGGEINAWIRIGTDDIVTFIVNQSEMGQGVLTSYPMILAEELEADWSQVRSELAPADTRFGSQGTGGSASIRTGYAKLRKVGAAAREMLVSAAAQNWRVDPSSCRAENGFVIHAASNRRMSYGQLAEKAATVTPPENPQLKDPRTFKLIGKPAKRLDTVSKVNGAGVFGMDVKVPGMLVAQVAHSPVFGGKLKSFDGSTALKIPDVRNVIAIPTGIAVVADNYWAATKGREALEIVWDEGTNGKLSSADITALFERMVDQGKVARSDGDPAGATAKATRKIEALYQVPYLAHATMEPMNCTADVRPDRCEIWAPTQFQTASRQLAAQITGLKPEQVMLHTTLLGGGFGRRAQTDFLADAVHTSKAVGQPVKVIYSREDDMRAGFYRPAAYNRMAGALDAEGWPVAWTHQIVSPSILEAFGPLKDGIDRTSVEGAENLPYAIPNMLVTYAKPDLPVTVWFWRSVGSSQNAFVTECFLDELAALGGKDPYELRRRLLANRPRHKRVLETAAQKAGWGAPLPQGRSRGIAVHQSFGSFVAQVAEVSLDGQGHVRVHRVVCAVDCGDVVNPDTVQAQMESGIAYGLSAALYGEITIQNGRAVQDNFDSYPVVRIDEMPAVETHIVTSGDALGGIGEPGTPPIAPAVCNAIYALTKKRIRKLPIKQLA
ncbi:MAG: xanthine dehydrogenase family protein molybdopterin-binding subunit [Gemmatimonadetes bacterium]|nr:xanthine dehydrogenase family protein molybdopterin-binding subunit [Gemmatimonadota bacterium]